MHAGVLLGAGSGVFCICADWVVALLGNFPAYGIPHLVQVGQLGAEDALGIAPDLQLALMGDFNIAPLDTDVWDIDYFAGATHVSEPERQAFEAFEQIGFSDLVRPLVADGYTYWDYQQLRFPKNEGMRIDFILGTETLAERVVKARIDRDERKGEGPSDHVPVVVELD